MATLLIVGNMDAARADIQGNGAVLLTSAEVLSQVCQALVNNPHIGIVLVSLIYCIAFLVLLLQSFLRHSCDCYAKVCWLTSLNSGAVCSTCIAHVDLDRLLVGCPRASLQPFVVAHLLATKLF